LTIQIGENELLELRKSLEKAKEEINRCLEYINKIEGKSREVKELKEEKRTSSTPYKRTPYKRGPVVGPYRGQVW